MGLKFGQDEKPSPAGDRVALAELESEGIAYRIEKRWFLTPKGYEAARGSSLAPEWRPSDAWILVAVLGRRSNPRIGLSDRIFPRGSRGGPRAEVSDRVTLRG
jgi:hypothetical protein